MIQEQSSSRSGRVSKSALLALLVVLLSGCSTTATLYPVEGPLARQKPLPVLTAKVEGILGNTGEISMTLPDGEFCTGKWASVAPTSAGIGVGTTAGTVTSGMASAWASAYGTGLYAGILPGVNRGEAMLVGERGTVIQVEFFTGSGTANGTGVAKDNKENIFKVLF